MRLWCCQPAELQNPDFVVKTFVIVPLAQQVCNVASQIWHKQKFFQWKYFNILMMVRKLTILGVIRFSTFLNKLTNRNPLWRDSALQVKPCVELRRFLVVAMSELAGCFLKNCIFFPLIQVAMCLYARSYDLNLLGVQLHFGPKAVGRGMQVHRLMEGRKLRNPRYSSFMIECPCAEKYLIL